MSAPTPAVRGDALGFLSQSALTALESLIDERVRAHLERYGSASASRWLSVRSAAEYLATTPAAVRQLIRRGHLRAYRPEGGSMLLSRVEIDAWVRGDDAPGLDLPTDWSYAVSDSESGAAARQRPAPGTEGISFDAE
jgi:excisionase family DNA binding protein